MHLRVNGSGTLVVTETTFTGRISNQCITSNGELMVVTLEPTAPKGTYRFIFQGVLPWLTRLTIEMDVKVNLTLNEARVFQVHIGEGAHLMLQSRLQELIMGSNTALSHLSGVTPQRMVAIM